MTRDEILNMPAGREMDALIAENVMGYQWGYKHAFSTLPTWSKNGIVVTLGDYSTDISAAWEVVEKLRGKRVMEISITKKSFWCTVYATGRNINEKADTAPLAICRAALLAVMEVEG